MIDAVNTASYPELKRREELRLEGWRDGLRDCGVNIGELLIDADHEQIHRGYTGPMCGGIYLNDN